MPIFKDNYFTNDTYALRKERLKILKNYIQDWAGPLSVPQSLVTWAENAYGEWEITLQKVEIRKEKRSQLYENLNETDETTFQFYLKCKRLLKSQFSNKEDILNHLGISGRFPRKRKKKIESVKKMLSAIEEDHELLSVEFTEKLQNLLTESENIYKKIQLLKEEKTLDPIEQYKEDAKKLRTLYSWALMRWEPNQPYLVQLGFAVKPSKDDLQKEEEEEDTDS